MVNKHSCHSSDLCSKEKVVKKSVFIRVICGKTKIKIYVMRKKIYLLIVCLTAALTIAAQNRVGQGTLTTHKKISTDNYDFWLYTPKNYDTSRRLPLVF